MQRSSPGQEAMDDKNPYHINSAPLVSVLMTSYNREKYIAEAIDSVLCSSYRDFELIIVDDGSKDRTIEIARQYAGKDQRVKVYLNEQNLGDYPNRNKAASYATGKYLKYVDADDLIYPWGLELLVQMMEKFPDAGWGLCSLEQDRNRIFPFELGPKEAYEYNFFGPGLFLKAPLSSIIKREIFEQSGGFAPLRMVGDYEMWHRLARNFPVVLMPHGIVWYREHSEQEMNSHSQFLGIYEGIKIKYLLAENCPLDSQAVNTILDSSKRHWKREVLKGMIRFDMKGIKLAFSRLHQYKNARKA
jgi:glycosyltransferase involved in cell wall biosynthesis